MKSLFIAFACLITLPALATEYAEYHDYGDTAYGTEEIDTTTDDFGDNHVVNCPVCRCNCDSNANRDNYMGLRVYKNEHVSYDYGYGHHKDDNLGFGTLVGNRLTDYLRVEYETLYIGSKFSEHGTNYDYDIWGNLLNAYLSQDFDGVVAPYVGIGIGASAMWGEIGNELDNAFDLSYQAMVGIMFELNSRISIDVGYKYVNYGRIKHNNVNSKIDATQIYLGASYKFGM